MLHIGWDQVEQAGRAVLAAEGQPTLVATDRQRSFVSLTLAGGGQGSVPQAALTLAGAPGCPDVPAAARALRELARAHAAQLAWAEVSPHEQVGAFFSAGWDRHRLNDDFLSLLGCDDRLLPDVAVPGAGWWQLLGPGHLARFTDLPAGLAALADERTELTVGKPEQWLPGAPGRT